MSDVTSIPIDPVAVCLLSILVLLIVCILSSNDLQIEVREEEDDG